MIAIIAVLCSLSSPPNCYLEQPAISEPIRSRRLNCRWCAGGAIPDADVRGFTAARDFRAEPHTLTRPERQDHGRAGEALQPASAQGHRLIFADASRAFGNGCRRKLVQS